MGNMALGEEQLSRPHRLKRHVVAMYEHMEAYGQGGVLYSSLDNILRLWIVYDIWSFSNRSPWHSLKYRKIPNAIC